MKRLSTIMMCLFAMMAASLSAKAQDVTITLMPGWTWISYPKEEAMDIPTALGDFAPMEGDMIKSQFGFAEYQNGQWVGGLQQFAPGVGYMYYSNRTEVVSFVFGGIAPFTVTTTEPTNIYGDGAIGGGTVTSNNGGFIMMKGICWATHPQPTTNDFYIENESGPGTFTAEMTNLSLNTVYYMRAYATNCDNTVYGDEMSFTTLNNNYGGHYYVDLGLPSGTLWATCNIGADASEEYGDYFAWGETQPKNYYSWGTYLYCNGGQSNLTKYCTNNNYGYNGFVDNLTTLLPEDDAATANWGVGWRMPTWEEWQELIDNTINTWVIQNGVNGRLFTASNGNSIFLPAAGYIYDDHLSNVGNWGDYWSSSLFSTPYSARACRIEQNYCGSNPYTNYRRLGRSVRPVRSPSKK